MKEADFGGVKMDKWTQHEGVDRAAILLSQMDTCFGYYDEELSHERTKTTFTRLFGMRSADTCLSKLTAIFINCTKRLESGKKT